jgi:FG-GAP-like repeat
MLTASKYRWPGLLVTSLFCGAAGIASIHCAPGGPSGGSGGAGSGAQQGAAGTTGGGGNSSPGTAGTSSGTPGTAGTNGGTPGTAGTGVGTPGTAGTGVGTPGTAGTGVGTPGTAGTGVGTPGTAGNNGAAGSNPVGGGTFMNYEVSGSWPKQPVAVKQVPGTLTYTKVAVHTRFLAESCSIADYNQDGAPDVSSGRRWYAGPAFTTEHIFRGGHDDLPRAGTDGAEIDTGVSDDWSDFPYDVDGDGAADIINIANCDVAAAKNPNPKPAPQGPGTAYWYKNPGKVALAAATDPMWVGTLMHGDVKLEQHGLGDVDGDGKPEIFGACKGCMPAETKGYYTAGATPTAGWVYHPVTTHYVFPFNGTGWMHGEGFGDINLDGKADLLERGGAWIAAGGAAPNVTPCPGAGCGWVKTTLYDGNAGENRGPSHMFATDIDGDGDMDIVAADWAHGWGLAWYEQNPALVFTRHQFMGSNSAADLAKFGAVIFSEPHAMQVVDMDGDGVADIVTGKMRFAHPVAYGDPDPMGTPFLYVFKTVRNKPSVAGSVTFEPHMVDMAVGVGRQLSVGHTNTDGIMDICIASKLGLFVFQGK